MKLFKYIILLCLISPLLHAAPLVLNSQNKQTTLIELYSSEGCSSCPPADQFISQFIGDDALWAQYIPLVFHVDYWDYLGWKDQFAKPEYSDRQRNYKTQGLLSSVYTPGFMVNGAEWTGFFKPWRALPKTKNHPGKLLVQVDKHLVTMTFQSKNDTLNYHLAIVGIGLKTQVKTGENAGHDLLHDFVVLHHQQQPGQTTVTMNLPLIVKHKPKQFALVAWVTDPDSMQPIQAVGDLLPDGSIKQI